MRTRLRVWEEPLAAVGARAANRKAVSRRSHGEAGAETAPGPDRSIAPRPWSGCSQGS